MMKIKEESTSNNSDDVPLICEDFCDVRWQFLKFVGETKFCGVRVFVK